MGISGPAAATHFDYLHLCSRRLGESTLWDDTKYPIGRRAPQCHIPDMSNIGQARHVVAGVVIVW